MPPTPYNWSVELVADDKFRMLTVSDTLGPTVTEPTCRLVPGFGLMVSGLPVMVTLKTALFTFVGIIPPVQLEVAVHAVPAPLPPDQEIFCARAFWPGSAARASSP